MGKSNPSRSTRDFSGISRLGLGPTRALFSWFQCSFQRIKWLGYKVNCSPCNAKVKNEWSLACTLPCVFVAWTGTTLIFFTVQAGFIIICFHQLLWASTFLGWTFMRCVENELSSDRIFKLCLLNYRIWKWRGQGGRGDRRTRGGSAQALQTPSSLWAQQLLQ